jgi:hypothetical protein
MLLPVMDWKGLFSTRGPKISLIGIAAVVLLGAGGVTGYYLWPEPAPKPPPPVATATLDQNAEYAISDDFNRLPMKKRLAWAEDQLKRVLSMDDEEVIRTWKAMGKEKRDRLFRNADAVVQEHVRQNVHKYHELPPSERKAFLDERLDEIDKIDRKLRKAIESTEGPRPRSAGGGGFAGGTAGDWDRMHRERMAAQDAGFRKGATKWMVNEPADRRAKAVTYFAALGKRQAERGIERLFGPKPGK